MAKTWVKCLTVMGMVCTAFIAGIGIVGGLIGFILMLSMVTACWWYTFDDSLATLTGVPALGTVNFFNMWGMTIFTAALFKGPAVGNAVKKASS